jgi:hypothetical protein
MNQEQFMSIVRAVLQIIGTALVSYSVKTGITDQIWTTISGSVLMVAPVIWGLVVHTQANAIAIVAKLPSTDVSAAGTTIKILDPALAKVAQANATPPSI